MAVLAFDSAQTRKYSLKRDTGENKTFFLLGGLNSKLSAYIHDHQTSFSVGAGGSNGQADVSINISERDRLAVKFGLRGWENFKDSKGKEVVFQRTKLGLNGLAPTDGLTDECLDSVKPYIAELATEILRDDVFTEADEKN
jgi:hypothetical protein